MKPIEIRDLEMKYGRLKRGRPDRYDKIMTWACMLGLLACAVLIVVGVTWRW